jgi:hypothetical protein
VSEALTLYASASERAASTLVRDGGAGVAIQNDGLITRRFLSLCSAKFNSDRVVICACSKPIHQDMVEWI